MHGYVLEVGSSCHMNSIIHTSKFLFANYHSCSFQLISNVDGFAKSDFKVFHLSEFLFQSLV